MDTAFFHAGDAVVDVFISYKRDDRRRAARVAKKLQELGLEVWLDARIPSGTSFDTEIESALKSAKAVLVLWSKTSAASEWVRNEASTGKERGILVALMVEPCELPIAFRSVQYEPLYDPRFGDDDPGWTKAIERIESLVGRSDEIEKTRRKVLSRSKTALLWKRIGATMFAAIIWSVGALHIGNLVEASSRSSVPVRMAGGRFDFAQWDRGEVSGNGTRVFGNNDIGNPFNEITFVCSRSEGKCTFAEAFLIDGNMLVANVYWKAIDRWDQDTIRGSHRECDVEESFSISRSTQSVTFLREPLPAPVYCGLTPPRTDVIRSTLEEGQRVTRDRQRAADGRTLPVFAGLLALWFLYISWRVYRIWRPRR